METRPLGATGHESSVVTLGAFALQFLESEAATAAARDALDSGVNHVGVAPTYGDAEQKLRPFLADHREAVFLGCKTQARDLAGAREEHRCLDGPPRRATRLSSRRWSERASASPRWATTSDGRSSSVAGSTSRRYPRGNPAGLSRRAGPAGGVR